MDAEVGRAQPMLPSPVDEGAVSELHNSVPRVRRSLSKKGREAVGEGKTSHKA